MEKRPRQCDDRRVIAAQLFVQNNLEQDLSIATICSAIGVSPSHFHRIFRSTVGETLKQYVDRLRIEKSMYDIQISELSLLDIALKNGFKNAETYSRTFKRLKGKSPSSLARQRLSQKPGISVKLSGTNGLRGSKESKFSITRLSKLNLAFIRHIGPYESVPPIKQSGDTLWRKLESLVISKQLAQRPFVYFGIPQDSPTNTESKRLRYDLGILIDDRTSLKPNEHMTVIQPGFYAVLTHAGCYDTLEKSYRTLFHNASCLRDYTIASRSAFELLLDISAKNSQTHTWTELYLPLDKV